MTEMTQDQGVANAIRERSFAVRFEASTPREVVHEALVRYNKALTGAGLTGLMFFPLEPRFEMHNGIPCQVSYLRADDTGWESFRNRGESFTPEAHSELRSVGLVAMSRPIGRLFEADRLAGSA